MSVPNADQAPSSPDSAASGVDLKKTLNLPLTDFPMKANLPTLEPNLLARWKSEDLYGQIRKSRAGRPRYVLHDGPPYANGAIHLGHVLNKTLKDFVVKSRTMMGFDSPYVPGYDCHGLPIEIKVDGQLGPKRHQMSTAQIRRACREYATKYINLQTEGFVRLGIFGEWENPYLTMSAHYQSVIARTFVEILEQGYIYKGLKPVNWCIHDRTALAEAEVEYENHSSPSVWVRFVMTSDPASVDAALAGKKVYGLIWTTTPWTLPANLGISFNPHFEYVAVEVGQDVYVVAEQLLKATAEVCGWSEPNVIARFKGMKLDGTVFRHPFLERDSIGMVGDHVTLEQGTGAVHTAPGHGQEDYVIGQRYGLPTYCPVDAQGRIFQAEGAPGELPSELLGKTVWDANPVVIQILQEKGALLGHVKIEHSYPHCWRCHNATIFRATEQWFIGMEKQTLRQRALDAIKRVKWTPGWGEERISNMIATRPDWCISRQRTWGVPIVAFYCSDCEQPMLDTKVLHRVVDLFAEHNADVWYEWTAEQLIGDSAIRCEKCSGNHFRKETDILDVWFDSGSSHMAVLTEQRGLAWPSQMYLEGGDQYRGWFHSSLLIGVALRDNAPYEACATNGWTLDAQGRAMSKSLGNGIEPDKIFKQYGAEILRLWVSSVEFYEDVRLSDEILKRLTEAYRKLRNTFRYALGNLHDFDPAKDAVPAGELLEIDRWILIRTEELVRHCLRWYEELAFHKVYRAIYDFATIDLSSVYFDILKDRLYTSAPRSQARRSAQTALQRITMALVRLLAPVMSFTTEEVWGQLAKPATETPSVHMAVFPTPEEITEGLSDADRTLIDRWAQLLNVRELVLKQLEVARQEKIIGAPLEAEVVLTAGPAIMPLLEEYRAMLPGIFIVSQVRLIPGEGDVQVAVAKSGDPKCERCWKFLPDVGSVAEYPTICASCAAAVREILQG